MNDNVVIVRVPPTPAHLAMLRTAIGGIAARDRFTIDQIDDLRMAVEEAATQLLHHVPKGRIEMTVVPTETGLEVRLAAQVDAPAKVIDESSFSWMILRALADDLRVESQRAGSTVVLSKHRLISRDQE
ncbi:MAG: ATP-binding protein [Egibacteraceae bacterium]